MAFCTKCGAEFPPSNQFCGKCGATRAPGSPGAELAKKRAPRWLVWTTLGLGGLAIIGALLPNTPEEKKSAPEAVASAAPTSESDFDSRLAEEKAKQAADTSAPITAEEREHGIDALCEAMMGQINQVLRGEEKAEDSNPAITLAQAGKILRDRYGASDYRAIAIMGAATKEMQSGDPNGANGNLVEYCTRRAEGVSPR